MLTAGTLDRLIDLVEPDNGWLPRVLILPSWFPQGQLGFADQWAKEHGWTGVRRG